MQVSIFAITIPRDFHQKFAPTLGLLHPSFCPAGGDLLGVAPEGRAFVYKRFLPFLEFSLHWQKLATDSTLGFICCSEILYVFYKIIQSWIEPKLKKSKMIFSD